MMTDQFDPSRFVKLTNFSGGWIWVPQVNEKIQKLVPLFEKISREKLREIWNIIGAIEKPWKPHADTEFCVLIKPISNFGILLIFDQGDEEFPSELAAYYEKISLEVPTEDAYVFTESYLELMMQIARSQNILIIDTNDLISLGDLADKHPDLERKKVRDDIIVQRFEPIKYINKETAMKVASNLKVNFMSEWEFEKADWVLGFELFEDLSIFYVKYWDNSKPEMEIYYHVSVLKYDLHVIMNFSWLFLNAVIREGRKILGDKMPRISEFL